MLLQAKFAERPTGAILRRRRVMTDAVGSIAGRFFRALVGAFWRVRVRPAFALALTPAALIAAALSTDFHTQAQAADCSAAARPSTDWSGCDRRNLMIGGSNLDGADLRGADLSLSDLSNAKLKSADLVDAKLVRASLTGAMADGADFEKVEGYRTIFSKISAKGASFKSAELQRADFSGANLADSNFQKAELGRAIFTGAEFSDNVFAFANLARADFRKASIAGSLDFSNAYMFLTRIDGEDLSSAKGLQQAQIDLACGDGDTKLPEGLKPPQTWPCGSE